MKLLRRLNQYGGNPVNNNNFYLLIIIIALSFVAYDYYNTRKTNPKLYDSDYDYKTKTTTPVTVSVPVVPALCALQFLCVLGFLKPRTGPGCTRTAKCPSEHPCHL